jgi:hypothetical protein
MESGIKEILDRLSTDELQKLSLVLSGMEIQSKRMYSEEEVELIANEMVNWAIDNVGNPDPQSGKKFDEVMTKFRKK